MSNPENAILTFLEKGDDINSEEGLLLIKNSDIATLVEALNSPEEQSHLAFNLAKIMDDCRNDPFLRRKIMLALGS